MPRAVVLSAVRTPVGRYGGDLAEVRPDDLAALAVRAAVDRSGVPEEQIEELHDRIGEAGIPVSDDCGRPRVPPTSYANGELSHYTVDAMAQFLSGASRYRLLSGREERELTD